MRFSFNKVELHPVNPAKGLMNLAGGWGGIYRSVDDSLFRLADNQKRGIAEGVER